MDNKSNVTTNDDSGLATIAALDAGTVIAAMHGRSGTVLEVPKPFSQPICLIPKTRVAGHHPPTPQAAP